MRIYLDANFFIAFVEDRTVDLSSVILWSSRPGWRLINSEFTVAEVLVLPLRLGDARLVGIYEALIGETEVFEVWPVTRSVLKTCAEVRASIGNKAPDAIHVATAALAGCHIFLSSDQRVRLPDGLRRVSLDRISELGAMP